MLLMVCMGTSFSLPDRVRSDDTTQSVSPKQMTIPAVVASVRPSVVSILTRGVSPTPFQHPSPSGSGSGLIIDEKGYILTNNHLVEGTKNLVVGLPSGRLTPGRVVGRDFLLDLAGIGATLLILLLRASMTTSVGTASPQGAARP